MKTPVLPACFAAAALATAAPLPLVDPARVAADWNQTFEEARQPLLVPGPLGLSVAPPKTSAPERSARPLAARYRHEEPLYDAPSSRVPRELPDNLPPGAKAWPYRGQKFWVIPVSPSGDK